MYHFGDLDNKENDSTSQQAGGIFVEKIMLKVVLAIKVICSVTWFVTVVTYVVYTACQWIRYALRRRNRKE